MKRVDMAGVDLVHSGEAWEHAHPPCSRQMIWHLEKNEGLVTWVQVWLALVCLGGPRLTPGSAQGGHRAGPVPRHADR